MYLAPIVYSGTPVVREGKILADLLRNTSSFAFANLPLDSRG